MGKKPDTIPTESNTERALYRDVLSSVDRRNYPARLDWLASFVDREGDYTLNPGQKQPTFLSPINLSSTIEELYVEGLRDLVGRSGSVTALADAVDVGSVVAEYTALVNGIQRVNTELPPGEVLGRLLIRDLQRYSGTARRAAEGFTEAATPRELLQQLATSPEAAAAVDDLVASVDDAGSLPDQLAQVQLATRMWDHQRRGLAEWLTASGEGYVDMATATGKTVLGLAAVGYCTQSGSLHPVDREWLTDQFDGDLPTVSNNQADDVLIVTTDDLLGAQWSRLFEQHCHTPPEYTQIIDSSISLPWGDIDIYPANALSGLDPSDYRLAIFDEVHNYSQSGGWGGQLRRFVESSCPVLALTGSDTQTLSSLVDDTTFEKVFEYGHEEALRDGVIPEFDWTLSFTTVNEEMSSTLDSLRETAEIFERSVDAHPGELSLREALVDDLPEEAIEALTQPFDTPRAMASGLRDAGTDGRAPTAELETLASGLAGRKTHWWNLRPAFDTVEDRVTEAIAAERPTLLLTQSYAEAEVAAERIDDLGAEHITRLERGTDAQTQAEQIEAFDDKRTGQKVLIGPGERIGTGIDIQSIEVGINLARPGTGVSASLVQRLGRLLRKTEQTDSVEFYHVLGLPPTEAIIPIDGDSFVEDVVEFFSQVEIPTTDGMTKPPDVSVAGRARECVTKLERAGAQWHPETEATDDVTGAYLEQIETVGTEPAVATDWFSSASRWGGGTVTATVVTDGGDRACGPETLSVVLPTGINTAVVTVSSQEIRGVCSVSDADCARFDGLDTGNYRVVVSTDQSVWCEDVNVDGERNIANFSKK